MYNIGDESKFQTDDELDSAVNETLKTFRERLGKARTSKKLTQDKFASALHYESRGTIANWESATKEKYPTLKAFIKIYKTLGVEPHYLLGITDTPIKSNSDAARFLNISEDAVIKLGQNKSSGRFIDSLVRSETFDELTRRITQLCYHQVVSGALDTTFTPNALKIIRDTFDSFYRNVFPLDMNESVFSSYLQKNFHWNSDEMPIEDFIATIINKKEYENFMNAHREIFKDKSDDEKYNLFIEDIAGMSFDILMSNPIIELAEQEITRLLHSVVKDIVEAEVKDFKRRAKENYQQKAKAYSKSKILLHIF